MSTQSLHASLSRANMDVTERLQRVGRELATQRLAEPMQQAPVSSLSDLVSARRAAENAGRHLDALTLAAGRAGATAVAIGALRESVTGLPEQMLHMGTTESSAAGEPIAQRAALALDAAVGALNTQSGGRHLFAGTATDRAPLADADTITGAARAAYDSAMAGGTSAAAAVAAAVSAVQTGFADGSLYRGATAGTVAVHGNGSGIAYGARADEPALRDTIAGLAVAAAVAGKTPGERAAALNAAAVHLLSQRDNVIAVEARVGTAQAAIEDAQESGRAHLGGARERLQALEGVDPYTAATELEELRVQLETIYAVTGRIAGMSLAGRL